MSARRLTNAQLNDAARHYDGPYKPYDLVRELCIAIAVVGALALALTIFFSSPDLKPSTIEQWSQQMPVDFVTTAVSQLDGTSETATYGPPYNDDTADSQHAWFIKPAAWLGISHPINTQQDYVYGPLAAIPGDPSLRAAVATYRAASAKDQNNWTNNYTNALAKATVGPGNTVKLPAGDYGPVTTMMGALLTLAQSGGLDGALLTSSQFFQTDYTKALLFLEDGSELADRAQTQHLLGSQWGMMNETGSYPGQVWLWLYTFWYQIKPFSTSSNGDLLVFMVMAVLSLALILIPFIPGVRDIPRLIPIYRLIWRDYYRDLRAPAAPPAQGPPPSGEPPGAAAAAAP
jgi:hypothetical protein